MESFKNYIDYCLNELIEREKEATDNAINGTQDFQNGYSLAYKEVITFLVNQADTFQIKHELSEVIRDFKTPL
jgi:hypothetical protein